LGAAATIVILSGQFATAGALYGYSFMGIAGGVMVALKDAFQPSGSGAYVLMIVGALLIIALMILLFAGLLLGLVLAIYIAVRRSVPGVTSRLVSFLFGGVSLATFTGLALSRWLATSPDFHGEVRIETYYFLWPALFALLAVLYATLMPNSRNV
jgi:hypothetical protein